MPCAQQAMYRHPCRLCQKPMQSGRGAPAHAPDLEARCIFCFLSGMVGLRAASNMTAPPPSLSKANAKWSRGARACSRFGGKVHYVFVLTGMLCVCVVGGGGGIVSGSPPVGWGRGCLLIRSSDNPLPRAGEGGFLTAIIQIVKPPTPRGLVGFWIWLGGIGGNNLTRLETPMGWGDFLCQRKMPQLRCTS